VQIIDSFIPRKRGDSPKSPSIPSQKPEILLNIWAVLYALIERTGTQYKWGENLVRVSEEPYEEPRGAGYSPNSLI
jgi:hypothetical protein